MTCLDATFTLTPTSPVYWHGLTNYALLDCWGADFFNSSPYDLSSLYNTDRFYFDAFTAGDPGLNYADWKNRARVPFVRMQSNLTDFGSSKQLALIFAFDAPSSYWQGRVRVYDDYGFIHDQTLTPGDNQFLLEIEAVNNLINLYFMHVGGMWFFKGFSGYVV